MTMIKLYVYLSAKFYTQTDKTSSLLVTLDLPCNNSQACVCVYMCPIPEERNKPSGTCPEIYSSTVPDLNTEGCRL